MDAVVCTFEFVFLRFVGGFVVESFCEAVEVVFGTFEVCFLRFVCGFVGESFVEVLVRCEAIGCICLTI